MLRTSQTRMQSFNSMIVRLKDKCNLNDLLIVIQFQFYDSPIKSGIFQDNVIAGVDSFNSMIVRLKVPPLRPGRFFVRGFNSMIVRLKGTRPYCLKKVAFKRFNSMIVRLKE